MAARGAIGDLHAPITWFGGKSKAAPAVWGYLGNPDTFIEPFCGSCAVLLARPHRPRVETINDQSSLLVNFWRSVKGDPDKTTDYADGPETEVDLIARHMHMTRTEEARLFRRKVRRDPEFYDPKFAGWWVWGMCAWIGQGWCDSSITPGRKMPRLGSGDGFQSSIPDAFRPADDPCARRRQWIQQWFQRLQNRLRHVRVACGDWLRVCDSPTALGTGTTGIFLDPPYRIKTESGETRCETYENDGDHVDEVVDAVIAYCKERGGNKKMRIVACSYAGEGYEELLPLGWKGIPWKARGGFGNQAKDGINKNAARERLWVSPHCNFAQDGFGI